MYSLLFAGKPPKRNQYGMIINEKTHEMAKLNKQALLPIVTKRQLPPEQDHWSALSKPNRGGKSGESDQNLPASPKSQISQFIGPMPQKKPIMSYYINVVLDQKKEGEKFSLQDLRHAVNHVKETFGDSRGVHLETLKKEIHKFNARPDKSLKVTEVNYGAKKTWVNAKVRGYVMTKATEYPEKQVISPNSEWVI